VSKKKFTLKAKHKDPSGGLNSAGRNAYNSATGGNLKPPAPNPKTKKDASRRKSFCSRMGGQKRAHGIDCAKEPKKRICKALKKWNC
jgi:hypothetical protein